LHRFFQKAATCLQLPRDKVPIFFALSGQQAIVLTMEQTAWLAPMRTVTDMFSTLMQTFYDWVGAQLDRMPLSLIPTAAVFDSCGIPNIRMM
jgi:hypothetical protein